MHLSPSLSEQRRRAGRGQSCCYCKRVMRPNGSTDSGDNAPEAAYARGLEVTMEHKLARNMGGTNARENIAWACSRCNNLRGHIPYEAFLDFARHVIRAHPDHPTPLLRNALDQYLMELVAHAMKNELLMRRAAMNSLLRLADESRGR